MDDNEVTTGETVDLNVPPGQTAVPPGQGMNPPTPTPSPSPMPEKPAEDTTPTGV